MNRHEAAAAEIAAAGMRHGERVADGNGRIHGISTLAQNGRTYIRGEMLCRHDHAVSRFQCGRRGSVRGCESG